MRKQIILLAGFCNLILVCSAIAGSFFQGDCISMMIGVIAMILTIVYWREIYETL